MGRNIKTTPHYFSRSMRWAMAALMYAFTLSPALSAAARITSFWPFSTVRLIRSYACFIKSLLYLIASDLFLYATVYISPQRYYSTAWYITQWSMCTKTSKELCAICHIDGPLRKVLPYRHRQDSHTGHSKADGSRRRSKTRTPIRAGTDKGDWDCKRHRCLTPPAAVTAKRKENEKCQVWKSWAK